MSKRPCWVGRCLMVQVDQVSGQNAAVQLVVVVGVVVLFENTVGYGGFYSGNYPKVDEL